MGYLRLILSLVIMATHLAGFTPRITAIAVMVFYGLSGYLATLKMSQPTVKALPFLVSRFWRLWPSYIIVFLATLAVFNVGLIDSIGGGITGWRFALQFVMIGPAWPVESVIAPAWMLKYIILGYLLIALGTAKTPARSAIALVFTLLWGSSIPLVEDLPYGGYYLSAAFALQFIFAGACCCHLGVVLPRDGRWAAMAGALSYPVFLAHYGVGAVVAGVLGWGVGWPLLAVSIAPTLALSWLLVVAVEQPIARYRQKLKTHG